MMRKIPLKFNLESTKKHLLIFNVEPKLHVKNYSLNAICSYWTECTNVWIACKADCSQEWHLFISTKHPHLPTL